AWDIVWLLERFPSIDRMRLARWVRQLAMPRAFWVPGNVISKGIVPLVDDLMLETPRDERQRRLERVADVRMFSAIETAYEINPISKNGFFLMLHDSNVGRARHVASLFRREERESRRSAARMLREDETLGNHSVLALHLREGVAQWKQFQRLTGS
ncbi:MAG TPA: hypothetical protein VFC35_01620, partial [Gemmatimonadaceae bacterium]|nr:hypothetical protein [Gemmatimonadaceae bacterium]